MTPLERAARAVHESHRGPIVDFVRERGMKSEAEIESRRPPWERETAAMRKPYLDAARAVLTAIREPSEGMREAGEFMEDDGTVRDPTWAWQRMIDAMLAEGE